MSGPAPKVKFNGKLLSDIAKELGISYQTAYSRYIGNPKRPKKGRREKFWNSHAPSLFEELLGIPKRKR